MKNREKGNNQHRKKSLASNRKYPLCEIAGNRRIKASSLVIANVVQCFFTNGVVITLDSPFTILIGEIGKSYTEWVYRSILTFASWGLNVNLDSCSFRGVCAIAVNGVGTVISWKDRKDMVREEWSKNSVRSNFLWVNERRRIFFSSRYLSFRVNVNRKVSKAKLLNRRW